MTPDERFDRIDRSLAELTRTTENLTRYVQDFRTETITRFQIIESRLDVLAATMVTIDVRMPGLTKAIVDFGATATRLHLEPVRIAKLVEPAA